MNTTLQQIGPSDVDIMRYGSWLETSEASANALRGIGTNAIAFYLRKLRRQIGPATSELRRLHALSVLMTSGSAVSTRSADRPQSR